MHKSLIVLVAILMVANLAYSQESVNAGGGDISEEEGNVSYSVGQVFYSIYDGTNGSASEGVQQTFEISEVYISTQVNVPVINCSVFPNPTDAVIRLSIKAEDFSGFKYSLYTVEGRLLDEDYIHTSLTTIRIDELNSATYLLEIYKDDTPIKTFQIVKK